VLDVVEVGVCVGVLEADADAVDVSVITPVNVNMDELEGLPEIERIRLGVAVASGEREGVRKLL
jgi:hypothetical protein